MTQLFECRMKCELPSIVDALVKGIHATPRINHIEKHDLPSRKRILEIIEGLFALLFPGYYRQDLCNANLEYFVGDRVDGLFVLLREQVTKALLHEEGSGDCLSVAEASAKAEEISVKFLAHLPETGRLCETDLQAAYDGDPAAKSLAEIIFAYPGFQAITTYRLAHELYAMGVPLIPRFMTEHAHQQTGIDLHPGATIGEAFSIDHGTGVVVGETTEIGRNVQMYHGVTLGAFSPRKGQRIRGQKRHPTIEDGVTIYPNATILGGETVVGAGSVIGGNVWLTRSVPPGSRVLMEAPEPKILANGEGPRPRRESGEGEKYE